MNIKKPNKIFNDKRRCKKSESIWLCQDVQDSKGWRGDNVENIKPERKEDIIVPQLLRLRYKTSIKKLRKHIIYHRNAKHENTNQQKTSTGNIYD